MTPTRPASSGRRPDRRLGRLRLHRRRHRHVSLARREAANAETYGSARWANADEVKAAGLLGPDGVMLGRLDGEYLRHDGPEHVLCFAPTRSGKGVGLVVPSLLTWPGSCIVHDIKGENWSLTAGLRARFGRVLC
jgi:type IV secretion system protein VirD4